MVFGSPGEQALGEYVCAESGGAAIAATGKMNLRATAGAVSLSEAAVGNDSGGIHLAAALGRPVVAIFGSTSPTWTSPRGKRTRIVYKALDCSPCFGRECTLGYQCLRDIGIAEVLRELMSLLGSGQPDASD